MFKNFWQNSKSILAIYCYFFKKVMNLLSTANESVKLNGQLLQKYPPIHTKSLLDSDSHNCKYKNTESFKSWKMATFVNIDIKLRVKWKYIGCF